MTYKFSVVVYSSSTPASALVTKSSGISSSSCSLYSPCGSMSHLRTWGETLWLLGAVMSSIFIYSLCSSPPEIKMHRQQQHALKESQL